MKRALSMRIAVIAAALALPLVGVEHSASANQDAGRDGPADAIEAMSEGTGLTAAEMQVQLTKEDQAADVEQVLGASLGTAFAGAWYTPETGKLTAAITDPSKASEVVAHGANAKVVKHTTAELDAVQAALDDKADSLPSSITGWYVDPARNRIAIEVNRSVASASAEQAVAAVVGRTAPVRFVDVPQNPELLIDDNLAPSATYPIRGGDPWYGPGFRCSIGFSAQDAHGGKHFITAGHCTQGKGKAIGYNGKPIGKINGSVLGTRGDFGKVDVTNNRWNLTSWVNRHKGGKHVTVKGAKEAPIGVHVCRSGSTSGWHCGRILAKNQTVHYPDLIVKGLTKTNACAEPGDSGGSFLWGHQAQGMTSGGSGDCTHGGATYFSPIKPALTKWNLQLTTSR
jgi:streptogrisin C